MRRISTGFQSRFPGNIWVTKVNNIPGNGTVYARRYPKAFGEMNWRETAHSRPTLMWGVHIEYLDFELRELRKDGD